MSKTSRRTANAYRRGMQHTLDNEKQHRIYTKDKSVFTYDEKYKEAREWKENAQLRTEQRQQLYAQRRDERYAKWWNEHIYDNVNNLLAKQEEQQQKQTKTNPVRPRGTQRQETDTRDNKMRGWGTSLQALSIVSRAIYAYGNLYYQDKASTDRVKSRIDAIRGAESFVSVGLSLIPVAGPALASTWSFATQIFSRHISNSIQRRGDTKRIAYNFANYDLGKYGTYAYDNTSQEWVAQDANKVKSRTLGQKQSV